MHFISLDLSTVPGTRKAESFPSGFYAHVHPGLGHKGLNFAELGIGGLDTTFLQPLTLEDSLTSVSHSRNYNQGYIHKVV